MRLRGKGVASFMCGVASKVCDRRGIETGSISRLWQTLLAPPDMKLANRFRPSRLHDRLRYTLQDSGWLRERLAP